MSGASLSADCATVRSARTPRPTRTPHRKITTETTVAAMNRNTSCLPFSWISWKPSSAVGDAMRAELYHSVREVQVPPADLFRELLEHVSGLSRLRIQCQRTSRFAAGKLEIARFEMRLRERRVRFGGLATPDRNVQCLDRFTHSSASQINPAHQQMRFSVIRRKKQRAPQLIKRIAIAFLFVEAPCSIEIEARELLLIALIARGERRFDLTRMRELHITFETLEPFRNRIGRRPLRPLGIG